MKLSRGAKIGLAVASLVIIVAVIVGTLFGVGVIKVGKKRYATLTDLVHSSASSSGHKSVQQMDICNNFLGSLTRVVNSSPEVAKAAAKHFGVDKCVATVSASGLDTTGLNEAACLSGMAMRAENQPLVFTVNVEKFTTENVHLAASELLQTDTTVVQITYYEPENNPGQVTFSMYPVDISKISLADSKLDAASKFGPSVTATQGVRAQKTFFAGLKDTLDKIRC